MLNRRFTVLTFAAVALATFIAPASASAQNIWDRRPIVETIILRL